MSSIYLCTVCSGTHPTSQLCCQKFLLGTAACRHRCLLGSSILGDSCRHGHGWHNSTLLGRCSSWMPQCGSWRCRSHRVLAWQYPGYSRNQRDKYHLGRGKKALIVIAFFRQGFTTIQTCSHLHTDKSTLLKKLFHVFRKVIVFWFIVSFCPQWK